MIPLLQLGYGILGAVLVSAPLIWRLGFGQVRHSLSIVGAVSILLANAYFLRSKGIIKFGARQRWIKYHQTMAGFGLTLVTIHSAVRPMAWHSWLPLILATGSLVTGLTISLVSGSHRRPILLVHSLVAPVLLLSIVFHGREKLDHDAFFPLTADHNVACVQCHTTPDYQSYTCLTCHIHNNSKVIEPHSIHGVVPYDPTPVEVQTLAQCLDCHQTQMNSREYGKRRANWNYNPD